MNKLYYALALLFTLVLGYLWGKSGATSHTPQSKEEQTISSSSRSTNRGKSTQGIDQGFASEETLQLERQIQSAAAGEMRSLLLRSLNVSDVHEQRSLVFQCLLKMNADNWESMVLTFAEITSETGRDHNNMWKSALMRTSQVAGEAAMEKLKQAGLQPKGDEAWQTLYGWSSKEPSNALAWLQKQEAEGQTIPIHLYNAVIAGAGLLGPEKAIEMMETIPIEKARDGIGHLVWNLIQNGGFDDAKAMLDYADKVSADASKLNVGKNLRFEIEKKLLWSAGSGARPDLAYQHIETLARSAADVPKLAERALDGFTGNKAELGLQLVDQLYQNANYRDQQGMQIVVTRAYMEARESRPEELQKWQQDHPTSTLIPFFQHLNALIEPHE